MTTTTIPAPRRITTLQYLRASIAARLGLEPNPEGPTAEWVESLRTGRIPASITGTTSTSGGGRA